jgi:hypothetical protein
MGLFGTRKLMAAGRDMRTFLCPLSHPCSISTTMEGYTWTFGKTTVNIFFNGKVWGGVCSTTHKGQKPSLPSDQSIEYSFEGDLPDHVLNAIRADANERRTQELPPVQDAP